MDASILIVEDDVELCEIYADIITFKEKGYDVHTVLTGEEGLKKADEIPFNLAIIDIMLPDMDGTEVLKRLKEKYPDLYCMMATANSSIKYSIKALNEGAYAYLQKPIEGDEMMATIRRALLEQKLSLKLEASERKHREFVENVPDGIATIQFEGGIILSINPAFCHLVDYSDEELTGASVIDLDILKTKDYERMKELLEKDGGFYELEFAIKTRSGETKMVSGTSRAIYDDSRKLNESEGVFRDITEKKQAEEELSRYRHHLEELVEKRTSELSFTNERLEREITWRKHLENEALKAKKETELYLDLMCHDINNKNHMAIFPTNQLSKDETLDVKQRKMVKLISNSIQESSRIIEHVRKLRQIKQKDDKSYNINLNTLIQEIIEDYSKSPIKDVEINYEPKDVNVCANELLKDVLSNLLDNAIKYSGDNVSITVMVEDFDHTIKATVEDNGNGISDELKGLIFNRLERGKESVHGSGLGLYIVKSLIEGYGGRIWVEDRIEGDYTQGSRFCIDLPKVSEDM